jgi:prepilin-type N-terminal cleavage/methylation domain-containing protein/prepilin-type processing-associated H-X9-DG protein
MRSKAFTLVELLVVIFILGLLLGILVPVLSKSRQKAKSLNCGLNLKRIAAVMSIYEQNNSTFPRGFDFKGDEVPPGDYVGDPSYDPLNWWWFHTLEDIFKQQAFDRDELLWCPSRNVYDPGEKENILCGNYGVNRSICKDYLGFTPPDDEFIGMPLSINQIKQTSQAILLMDSGYTLISWRAAVENNDRIYENRDREEHFYVPGLSINTKRNISNRCLDDANFGRHLNRRINIAFVDLHVESRKSDDVLVEEENGEYSNLSLTWKPK